MNTHTRLGGLMTVGLLVLSAACGSDDKGSDNRPVDGSADSGLDDPVTGGFAGTGGLVGTGGFSGTAGFPSTGGFPSAGGYPGTGGIHRGGAGGDNGSSGECGGECDDLVYTTCTCDENDPCAWAGDGYCDDACSTLVSNPFDDLRDCGNSGGSAGSAGSGGETCGGECVGLLYTGCTCAANDPCGWANDGYCDDDCSNVVPNPFDDFGDCGGTGGSGGSGGTGGSGTGGSGGGCIPNCGGLECGLDPVCGVSCGTCSGQDECIGGECICQSTCSSCEGRICPASGACSQVQCVPTGGTDGCGRSCSQCQCVN